MLFYVIR